MLARLRFLQMLRGTTRSVFLLAVALLSCWSVIVGLTVTLYANKHDYEHSLDLLKSLSRLD